MVDISAPVGRIPHDAGGRDPAMETSDSGSGPADETHGRGDSECVWKCARGRTRLACQLRSHREDEIEVEVVRNNRLYGTYRFAQRVAALAFATRLLDTFSANGWLTT